nr:PREDICTED: FBD-associated F-box protein At4g10400-like [Daucus carota subsp. sativus]
MDAWAHLRDICQEYNTNVIKKKRRLFHKVNLAEDYDHGVDLISGLPDDVLIHVLILMGDMKTAGRTSILSKRWKHVWTHLMDLDFRNDPETIASLRLTSYPQPEMEKFVEWVNGVISANRAPYLDSLRIHMPLSTCYGAHIHNWVQFAFAKEVHHLELNFGPHHYGHRKNYPRINFSDILSTNRALILSTALKSLHLETVIIEGPLIQWVLTNCLNLQRLSVHDCRASTDYYNDDASSEHSRELVVSSPELKHLEFFRSLWPLNFQILRVFAPNLTSFINGEANIDVEYRSIPSLVDATFVGAYLPDSDTLSGMASQLEKLSVNWYKLRSAFSGFPTFPNLQQLEIVLWQQDYDLILSTSLIEACPLLHTFKLKLMYHDQARRISPSNPQQIVAPDNAQENAIRCHEQLKTVEYRGYAGCAIAAELAICLAQHAPNLQRFVFYTRRPETIENPRAVWTSEYEDRMRIERSVLEDLVERIQETQIRVNVVIL